MRHPCDPATENYLRALTRFQTLCRRVRHAFIHRATYASRSLRSAAAAFFSYFTRDSLRWQPQVTQLYIIDNCITAKCQ